MEDKTKLENLLKNFSFEDGMMMMKLKLFLHII